MAAYQISPDCVWRSGRSAVLCLDSAQVHPLAPCPRCCQPSSKPNVLLGCSTEWPEPLMQGAELVFVFDNCRSYCNSSRLHLGGRVALCLEIADGVGAVVARLRSQPFTLCSKSSLQATRARSASASPQQRPRTRVAPLSPPRVGTEGAPEGVGVAHDAAGQGHQDAPVLSDSRVASWPATAADGLQPADAPALPHASGQGAESSQEVLARQMDELEQMKQQNMTRVLLISQLLSMAPMGVPLPGRP
eukprot:m51a1_g1949 hypothetical protein (247) ;mRNA; r:982430-983298